MWEPINLGLTPTDQPDHPTAWRWMTCARMSTPSAMAGSLTVANPKIRPLATIAILTSLYPGVTVVLARMILHERFSLAQRTDLGLAAIAVVAIALN